MPLYVATPDAVLTEAELTALTTERQLSHPALAEACDKFLASGDATPPDGRPALWLLQGEAAFVDAGRGGGEDGDEGFVFVTAEDAAAAAAAEAATASTSTAAGEQQQQQQQQQQQHRVVPEFVGSADATTCVVAALWCPRSRLLWLGHLDAPPSPEVTARWAGLAAADSMAVPELFLAGGYAGAPQPDSGPALARAVLSSFHALATPIRLGLCCVGAANTGADGAPRAASLCLDLAAPGGTPRAWGFAPGARGPEVTRRFAAQHVREHPSRLVEVWDAATATLRLPAFDAMLPRGGWPAYFMARLAAMEDAQLLASFSTSPEHESDNFPEDMRAMARWLVAAQRGGSAERAAAARCLRYEWRWGGGGSGGDWVRVGGDGVGEASDGGAAAQVVADGAAVAAAKATVVCTS